MMTYLSDLRSNHYYGIEESNKVNLHGVSSYYHIKYKLQKASCNKLLSNNKNITLLKAYPLPKIESLVNQLAQYDFCNRIDIKSE